ncbi:hypothetical protein [Chlorobium phaeobacteroides]|uniref:hypothetical protein n=1 Tax=Chlorobium phaeobacteroides TaxID=1096 RepID=UPI000300CE4F|nr:hypothetical protein [Chlorobium phaeobacteroides]
MVLMDGCFGIVRLPEIYKLYMEQPCSLDEGSWLQEQLREVDPLPEKLMLSLRSNVLSRREGMEIPE